MVAHRLRQLREQKKLSQGNIEQRSGLLRSYISRVENGHTVPSVETLEKFARALEVPLYQLFFEVPQMPNLKKRLTVSDIAWGSPANERRTLNRFRPLLSRMTASDRQLLMSMAQNMARSAR